MVTLAAACTVAMGFAGQLQQMVIYGGNAALWAFPLGCLAMMLVSAPFSYLELPGPFRLLLRGVVLVAAIYGVAHWPDAPLVENGNALAHSLLWPSYWVLLVATPLAIWRPAFAVIPACYGLWSSVLGALAAQFPNPAVYDFRPMCYLVLCALGALAAHYWLTRAARLIGPNATETMESCRQPWLQFSMWFAICSHLGTYYSSALAKLELNGPFAAWVFENKLSDFMLPASEAQALVLQRWPWAADRFYHILDSSQWLMGPGIIVMQLLAGFMILGPKKLAFVLVFLLDVMHFGIWITSAALFWTWILLNVVIAFVFMKASWNKETLTPRIVAVMTVVLTYWVGGPIRLGWFDTPTYNSIQIVAVTQDDKRVAVPTMFFRQYSYYFSGYPYGGPPPGPYMVSTTRGLARDYATLTQARQCHEDPVLVPEDPVGWKEGAIVSFLRAYHSQALASADVDGVHEFRWYPHHTGLFAPPAPIDQLDLREVRSYIIVGEAVCLAWRDGQLHRTVHGTSEYRVDLD